jgi:hypothetical protein
MTTATLRPIRSGRRGVAAWTLFALEMAIAANALLGGVGLIVNGMGLPTAWLQDTPFGSWVVPGLLLLLFVGVPMTAAAVAEVRRGRSAYALSSAAGLVLVGWIVAQVVVLRHYFFLQPVLAAAGLLVMVLAWLVHARR